MKHKCEVCGAPTNLEYARKKLCYRHAFDLLFEHCADGEVQTLDLEAENERLGELITEAHTLLHIPRFEEYDVWVINWDEKAGKALGGRRSRWNAVSDFGNTSSTP